MLNLAVYTKLTRLMKIKDSVGDYNYYNINCCHDKNVKIQ
jgi:hypothetical protein